MGINITTNVGSCTLSDLSPKDSYWDRFKRASLALSLEYAKIGYHKESERLKDCSNWLKFSHDGKNYKLNDVRSCRIRFCPTCQWRKSLKMLANFSRVFPRIREDYPTSKFIFLTLTVKNCPASDLKLTVNHLAQSFRRLTRIKLWPGQGWIKKLEITRSDTGEAHPHLHALVMVPGRYFTADYLSHDKWVELWQQCLRVDYKPVIRIEVVKPKNEVLSKEGTELQSINQSQSDALLSAIRYTLKYEFKADKQQIESEFLSHLIPALRNTRSIEFCGCFRQYLKDKDMDESTCDLIHIDNEQSQIEEVKTQDIVFSFNKSRLCYLAS